MPYLIVVGAFNASGERASYASAGSNLWVTAPAGQSGYDHPAIITTDQMGHNRGYDVLFPEASPWTKPSTSTGTTSVPSTAPRPRRPTPPEPRPAAGEASGADLARRQAHPGEDGAPDRPGQAGSPLRFRRRGLPAAGALDGRRPGATGTQLVPLRGGALHSATAWVTNAAGYGFHNWYGFGALSVDDALQYADSYTPDSLASSPKPRLSTAPTSPTFRLRQRRRYAVAGLSTGSPPMPTSKR